MLVLAPNLVLTPTEAALPGAPLFLWRNIVTAANVAADSVAAGFPASNLANPSTIEEWRAASAGDVEIEIVTNSADEIDAVGIARHNFGTAGISVEIGFYDDAEWVSLVGPQVPPNDEPLLFRHTPQTLAALVIRLGEGSEAARAAVLYVGKLLVCERGYDVGPEMTPPRFARRTAVSTGTSVRGDFLGRVVSAEWIEGAKVTFSHLRPDWYRENFDPFVRAASRATPFFFAWSPQRYPDEVSYCWFADLTPVPMTNVVTGRKKIELTLAGISE